MTQNVGIVARIVNADSPREPTRIVCHALACKSFGREAIIEGRFRRRILLTRHFERLELLRTVAAKCSLVSPFSR
jgi:hypothetical protein